MEAGETHLDMLAKPGREVGGEREREARGRKKWFLELGGSRDNELTATPGAESEELHLVASLGSQIVACWTNEPLSLSLKFCLNLRKDEALFRNYTCGFCYGYCQFPNSRTFQTSMMTEKESWGSLSPGWRTKRLPYLN